jgi:3-dehydroquinate dehydratase-2
MKRLGEREPEIYGRTGLDELNAELLRWAREKGLDLRIFHSNSEGEIIDAIEAAVGWAEGIIINPGAYTHYSYAIRDAIAGANIPAIEVHISNIHARESFRARSVTAPACRGVITGLGTMSYVLAGEALLALEGK